MGFSENVRPRDENDLLTVRCSRSDLSYAIRTARATARRRTASRLGSGLAQQSGNRRVPDIA